MDRVSGINLTYRTAAPMCEEPPACLKGSVAKERRGERG